MDAHTVETLEEKVADFIAAHGLFAGRAPILLAVSGGADSVALLAVMKALSGAKVLSAPLACIHINHGLRGTQSDGDERFVAELADEMAIPCTTQRHDVSTYAAEHKLSIETAGRQVRLRCFAEAARARGCCWIATGHQKDDNAETVIQRLRRGTGFRGLAGIGPSRRLEQDLRLARPLLGCTRVEIIAYLRSRHLPWREDQTNADYSYSRNHVRHRLLPFLQDRSEGPLVDELSALAHAARKLRRRVGKYARSQATLCVAQENGTVAIEAESLAALPPVVAVELIRLQLAKVGCGERDMTQGHYEGILHLAQDGPANVGLTLPNGIDVRREYGRIVLAPKIAAPPEPADSATVAIPGTTTFDGRTIETHVLDRSELAGVDIRRDRRPDIEYLDLNRVDRPLVVRRRRGGDHFVPLGSSGHKKVGKFLTTAKVPRAMRAGVLVFEDAQRIVWLCPIRISEHAKVRGDTRRVLMLRVSK